MSNDKLAAAAVLRDEAARLRGITQLADDLERLGTIEKAIAEAEARLRTIQADEERAAANLERATVQAAKTISDAEARAVRLLADAEAANEAAAETSARARRELSHVLNNERRSTRAA